MIDLFQYLEEFVAESFHSPTSDNAIYYKIGLHKYNWNKSKRPQYNKRYNISKDNKRAGIIRFAKDVMYPLLKDREEIIHRDKWDLDGLIGETEYQLMHPHYWTLNGFVEQDHKRTRDILVVMECGNTKPYAVNTAQKRNFTSRYRAFADFVCISNPGIIPLEYSQFYPYRYDEWDHFAEKPDIAWKYTWVCASRFLAYKKKMGYKKVIVLFQNPYPQEWAEWMLKHDIDGCKDWMRIVHDKTFEKNYHRSLLQTFGGNKGLMHLRLIGQPVFRKEFEKDLLWALESDDDKKKFKELQDIIWQEDKNKRNEELEEFNKEFDVKPYEPTKGTDQSFALRTENDTDQDEVNKNKSFVEKFLEELPDRMKKAKKDENWHKHLVVFTVLDLLMLQHDQKLVKDPDSDYWNMWKAVKDVAGKNKDIEQLNSYCYVYRPLIDELGDKKAAQKYTNKIGVTQFWDDRRRSPDK